MYSRSGEATEAILKGGEAVIRSLKIQGIYTTTQ